MCRLQTHLSYLKKDSSNSRFQDIRWIQSPNSLLPIGAAANRPASNQMVEEEVNIVAHEIEEHIPALRRYACALSHNATTADDLVQECVVRALSKAHLYKPGTNLRAWLFTILHNLYISEVRRNGKWKEASDPEVALNSLSQPASQTHSVMLRTVSKAMADLPNEQRTILYSVGIEGKSYKEVSKEMGIPVGTVKSRCSRARTGLQRMLGDNLGAEGVTAEAA